MMVQADVKTFRSALAPTWVLHLASGGTRGLLAWQALTSSVGIFLANAIMALYLVGPARLQDAEAGLTLGASAAACLLATLPAARLIRTLGPRRFAIMSCLSRSILFALLPLAVSTWVCVCVVLLIGACEAAAFSVFQIIIAKALGEAARAEALAVRRSLGNVGFSLGGLLTAVVAGIGTRSAYTWAFELSALSLAVGAALLLRLPDPAAVETPQAAHGERSIRVLRDGRFLMMMGIATMMATSVNLLTIGVPLWVLRATTAPRWIIGILMMINTVLVVFLQVRVTRGTEDWAGARRAVMRSGWGFAVAVGFFALAGFVPMPFVVLPLVGATILAALAEMLDSAGWWTLSYHHPPSAKRSDYLAAFDMVPAAVNIVGAPLMILIVSLGAAGWALYAAMFAIAAQLATIVITADHIDPDLDTTADNPITRTVWSK